MSKLEMVGVVAIGRNEGNRLRQCLLSLQSEGVIIVYVDSGSTDDSVAFARSLGVHVIELDLTIPFTAARARNAGFDYLLTIAPNLEWVQFIDGDCRLATGWLQSAVSELIANPDVVVVCGRRREEFASDSIYNRLCDIEWNTPVGEAKACGGDSMMRVSALKKVGGFNPALIAGEEPELCVRLRQIGGKVMRIDGDMTWHDARMTRLSQWWKRSQRAGHAYAEGAWLHGNTPERHWVKESLSIWFWSLGLLLLTVATLRLTSGFSLLLIPMAYSWLGYKIYTYSLGSGLTFADATLFSCHCVFCKFPQLQGQIQFLLTRLLKRQPKLVEYKGL
ncbi:glycosyltransferase family 2 protein [Calothrix sp. UHCC 0171]|uniref:glycosyltransferase family 2 protein n=1 Tax=Calothrix sp. UHCC 0171 TaxID=3110245 RepID=UPI002B216DCC|nr:glycosyltransferase family 2 protein [Calothrix sp. UHCC 0171]MEA5573938.1 glycosyltransferase family 2 protein [Calothrix sp. UHCC 0171]